MRALVRMVYCVCLAGLVFTLTLCPLHLLPAHSQTLQGKLARLSVNESEEVKKMMENLLTGHDFILVDDDAAATVDVRVEESLGGSDPNVKVEYLVDIEVRLPGVGLAYSKSGFRGYDYGREREAKRSALNVLRHHIENDQLLMAKLNQASVQRYYDLKLPGGEKPESIGRRIAQLALNQEMQSELKAEMGKLLSQQKSLGEMVKSLAQDVKAGSGRLSEASLQQVLDNLKRLVMAQKIHYQLSGSCPEAESRDYRRTCAVLIRIARQSGQVAVRGLHKVYSSDYGLVYEKTAQYAGARYYDNLDTVKKSALGKYFGDQNLFIEMRAIGYHADMQAVVLTKCDADILLHANSKARCSASSEDLFSDGRIVIVPAD